MFINKSAEHKELKNNILALASEAVKAKKLENNITNKITAVNANADILDSFIILQPL